MIGGRGVVDVIGMSAWRDREVWCMITRDVKEADLKDSTEVVDSINATDTAAFADRIIVLLRLFGLQELRNGAGGLQIQACGLRTADGDMQRLRQHHQI